MRHLDLFSGIGGFTLAAGWAGIETMAFCEINEWASENALKRSWPNIPNLKDVTKLCTVGGIKTDEFTNTYGNIDLITAGVPCQPASIIGKRKGVKDRRWLWPDTFRIIEELLPTWVVCENPTGLLTLDGGDRFCEIIKRFQQTGYSVWWETIPASAVGGGHRRERVWITAYSSSQGLEGYSRYGNTHNRQKWEKTSEAGSITQKIVLPYRDSDRWWKDKSPVPIVVDGVPDPAFWKEAVIATGNAIVPQVAYEILRGISGEDNGQ